MNKEEYLQLAEEKWPELNQLKKEKKFYEYEKRFEEIWLELGRTVLEKSIGPTGNDRRVKKKILTRFGKVSIKNTHPFSVPLNGFRVSPYLQEQATFISQMEAYGQANATVEKLMRVNISTSQLYRITDTYGGLVEEEVKGGMPALEALPDEAVYAEMDGGMVFTDDGWQEVKVGRVFRQSDIEKQGQGTDRQQITESQYAAHLGHYGAFAETFGNGLRHYRDIGERLVFITDGAVWIYNWIKENFPLARAILDYFHVTEHLAKIGKLLIKDTDGLKKWLDQNKGRLLESETDKVIDSVRKLKAGTPAQVDAKQTEIQYLTKNRERMDYKLYREKGLQIGSGAIEASHRTLVQKRMKKSGQRWSNEGAQKMLNLRVCYKSQRWDLVVNKINRMAA